MILDPSICPKVSRILQSGCLYADAHRRLFPVLIGFGADLDYTTLPAKLRESGQWEVIGGTSYIAELLHAAPTTLNWRYHVKVIQRAFARRRATEIGGDLIRKAHDGMIRPLDLCRDTMATLAAMEKWLIESGADPS